MNNWTIIRELPIEVDIDKNGKKRKRHYVEVQCKCGTIRKKEMRDIKRNLCCSKCSGREYVGNISGAYFNKIKWRAQKAGLEFDLTKDFLWELFQKQNSKCALTGWPISFADGNYKQRHGGNTASLDRIDSERGYLEDNVQFVHKDINKLKSKFGQNYFIEMCHAVADYSLTHYNKQDRIPPSEESGWF